jgi:hypothetical protein
MTLDLYPMVGILAGLVVFLVLRLQTVADKHAEAYKTWDVERGRYVAALLAQAKSGDLVASSVVRPRPTTSGVPAEPKPQQLDA